MSLYAQNHPKQDIKISLTNFVLKNNINKEVILKHIFNIY